MGVIVAVVAVLLIVGYFVIPLLLERFGVLKLKEPPGGWRKRAGRERLEDDRPRPSGADGHGGGGSFGGGGASGGW